MTHRSAVLGMVVVTLLWSMAGVVTRHLEAARSFEVTFWRSGFNALALAAALFWMRGPSLVRSLRRAPWPVWLSGLCWSVMYTAFMVALTLTSVASVLVTMAVSPLLTALLARVVLKHRLPARTWLAIAVAGAGIAWMFGHDAEAAAGSAWGTLVAAAVPIASAVNWTLLQYASAERPALPNIGATVGAPVVTPVGEPAAAPADDMLLAVLIGALISAAVALPFATPLAASAHDLGLLALLGVVQLAVPCLLAVRVARELPAPQMALLGLLEVVFGVLWAWVGAGEQPTPAALTGGALVLGALVANELLASRSATSSGAALRPPARL